ncbi:MAG: TIGR01212 family radical SAM protein [Lachnospiraceae bacterium]|nr:TIGR01212 family radical SAM protein [Lachnospiraceae bacterium]
MDLYQGRRYYSADAYMKNTFKKKVYRLALDAGCTCPNRDGSVSVGGCSFCSEGGSGDFAEAHLEDIDEQIENAKMLVEHKCEGPYIAYFQSFTNTYGDTERLSDIFMKAAGNPDIVCVDIATRPDCLQDDKLEMLRQVNAVKPVWVELGLQTIHEETARAFNRGYELPVFEEAVEKLYKLGIPVIAHLILGLPGESHDDMINSARYIASKFPRVSGVKLSMLHILKGTRMGEEFIREPFHTFTLPEYADLLIDILEVLPPEMVVHRITGDGPRKLLIAPLWSMDKKNVLNTIAHRMKQRNTFQGKCFD